MEVECPQCLQPQSGREINRCDTSPSENAEWNNYRVIRDTWRIRKSYELLADAGDQLGAVRYGSYGTVW